MVQDGNDNVIYIRATTTGDLSHGRNHTCTRSIQRWYQKRFLFGLQRKFRQQVTFFKLCRMKFRASKKSGEAFLASWVQLSFGRMARTTSSRAMITGGLAKGITRCFNKQQTILLSGISLSTVKEEGMSRNGGMVVLARRCAVHALQPE